MSWQILLVEGDRLLWADTLQGSIDEAMATASAQAEALGILHRITGLRVVRSDPVRSAAPPGRFW